MPDKKISQLPILSVISPNALVAVAQNGITYQSTAYKIAQLFGTNTANTVVTDGVTISGNGASVPLSAIYPASTIYTDGVTIGGQGTQANPLTFLGANAINTNPTLTGTGSGSAPLSVANPLPAAGNGGQILAVVNGAAAWVDEKFVQAAAFENGVLTLTRSGGLSAIAIPISTGDNWGSQVVKHDTTLTGEGLDGNLLGINTAGAAAGEYLTFTGTGIAWATLNGSGETGDNWGSQVVKHNTTLTGEGLDGNLLAVANPLPAVGSSGQVLTVVNGAAVWAAATGSGGGLSAVASDATLTGDGTAGSLLSVANPLPAAGSNGQVLMVTGGIIGWADSAALSAVASDATLTGNGTAGSLLSVANPLPAAGSNGQVLTVTGGIIGWAAAANNYVTGITVTGTTTKTISLSRQGLSSLSVSFTDLTASGGTGDNWGSQVIVSDATLSGTGVLGDALAVAVPLPSDGQSNQFLKWISGSPSWVEGSLGGGLSAGTSDTTLTGDGTAGSVLSVVNPLPAGNSLNMLRHNGVAWVADTLIRNSGATIGIGGNQLPSAKVSIESTLQYGLLVFGSDSTQESFGMKSLSAVNSAFDTVGGYFKAINAGSGTPYAVQMEDGSEGIGKYLKCVTADGKAQWADAPSGLPSIGSDGQVLTVVGGIAAWAAPTGSGGGLSAVISDTTLTGDGTAGSVLSVANPLPAGTYRQTLRHNGTEWVADSFFNNSGFNVFFGAGEGGGSLEGMRGESAGTTTFAKVYAAQQESTATGHKYGFFSRAIGQNGANFGGWFEATNDDTGAATGVKIETTGSSSNFLLGLHVITNNTGTGTGYAARIEDGNEGVGKIFQCVDLDGNGKWGDVIPLLQESTIPSYTPNGTTQAIDLANNLSHKLDLGSATADVTLTLTGQKLGVSYIIEVTQHSSTARNIVFPSSVDWAGGTAPTISPAANAVDTIVLWWNGARFRGVYSQNFS